IQERSDIRDFWHFAAQVTESKLWQKALKRWTTKIINHPQLMQLPDTNNPLLMHLSRLCLMVGDHNYSSLGEDDKRRTTGDIALKQALIANTNRKTGKPKQSLDEHLLGVAQFTAAFSRLLPRFSEELPYLEDISPFAKRTPIERFQWQNRAWNLVKKHRKEARQQGFFGVNLASTGCGKTLGNARIMAALADPERGLRFTIALGLRVLTLQTGLALREKLHLDETDLAILVGGAAHRTLFDLQQQEQENKAEADHGSESEESLLRESVDYDNCALDKHTLGTIIHDPKARNLLYAPVVSCTIDHIIGATETARGGRHIVPILRLLTSDLILDEPDDFDQNDLPALSRLVHMAGMLGSNILLSSATLTPDMVQGLFVAYRQGRSHWQTNIGEKGAGIYCAWFDEFDQHIELCNDEQLFVSHHQKFIKKRIKELRAQPVRRVGDILPTALPKAPEGEKIHNSALAQLLIDASHHLHSDHHNTCPASGKTASVGLIRVANINPMFSLAQALYQCPQPEYTQIHLCCYHARQLLMLRSTLEQKLDRILNRNDHKSLFEHAEIRESVQTSNKQHHIFIVLATAVAEVGRDHDYDWAIIEPSSMRS
ncbi:MAG: type I-F CRISPR-associated helicase Cas3f, partial [Endozoicomonas sp.]